MKKIIFFTSCMLVSLIFNGQVSDSVLIVPDKDNSIYSENENSNGTGKLFVGASCDEGIRRALMHFDVSAMIPSGALITGVTLTMHVDSAAPSASTDVHALHLMNKMWGEGMSIGGAEGGMAVATDATWIDAMLVTEGWETAGGDFSGTASAISNLTGALGSYDWTSSNMITEVQNWVDNPSTNFGWILIGDELGACNVRSFGSKELGIAPSLSVTYDCNYTPIASCQPLTVFLDGLGTATINATDLDDGSLVPCGGGMTFSASQTTFTCTDILDTASAPRLVLSAVFDATLTGGTPKGVELYVIEDIPDLSIYGIGSANNGTGTAGVEFSFPEIAATAGTYLYLATDSAQFNNWFGFDPNYTTSAVNINGDDAIEVFKNGLVIDLLGDVAIDGSGEVWEYMDGWAYRNSNTGPDGNSFVMTHWTFSGINALDDDTTNLSAAMPIPVGTFSTTPIEGTEVVLSVIGDISSEIQTCTSIITVIDTLPPSYTCVEETTFVLDETGMLVLEPSAFAIGVLDACDVDTVTLSVDTLTCANEGENEVIVYVSDIYGNIDSCNVTVTIDASNVIEITDVELIDPICSGGSDGTINISIDGVLPFSIYWENEDGVALMEENSNVLDAIGAGNYSVFIENGIGCIATATYELMNPAEITADITIINESCPGEADGSVTLAIEGGTGEYTVIGMTEGLSVGDYSVVVSDDVCTKSFDFTIELQNELDLTITEDIAISLTSNEEDATYQWVSCPDFNPIDGEEDQTLLFDAESSSESFAVIVTSLDGTCVDTTDCILFNFQSISEEEAAKIKVYPNPTNGTIYLEIEDFKNPVSVQIVDLNGTVIYEKKVNKSVDEFDLNDLESGMYTIQIRSKRGILNRKITIF